MSFRAFLLSQFLFLFGLLFSPESQAQTQTCGDFNSDGEVNGMDITAYINAFTAGDLSADMNADGAITGSDLTDFLSAFFNSRNDPTACDSGSGSSSDRRIIPGTEFSGPTPTPPRRGSGGQIGYNAKAIARWNVVPFQTFSSDFNVGVVAFHISGIERVDFSANGGPWTSVREMTLNPRTNTWEYWAQLKASDFSEGAEVEVRAIVYPNVGRPRVLGNADLSDFRGEYAIKLTAHAGGALEYTVAPNGSDSTGTGSHSHPFRTIDRAVEEASAQSSNGDVGGTRILLREGSYQAYSGEAVANQRWLTITKAPGARRDHVRIRYQGRPRTFLNRYENVTLVPHSSTLFEGYTDFNRLLWLDNVFVDGSNRYGNIRGISNRYKVFVTNSRYEDVPDGPKNAVLVRNVEVVRIKSDAFSDAQLVISSSVEDIDPGTTGAHPDVYQVYSPNESVDNRILYGVKAFDAIAQGLFLGVTPDGEGVTNFAVVNVLIEDNPTVMGSQWNNSNSSHVLIWGSTLLSGFRFRTSEIQDFSIRGSVFDKMSIVNIDLDDLLQGIRAADNHFIDGTGYQAITPGIGVSIGDPRFVSPAYRNYRPRQNSPLLYRMNNPPVAVDILNQARNFPASVGAFERD